MCAAQFSFASKKAEAHCVHLPSTHPDKHMIFLAKT